MASLTAIMDALATQIDARIGSGGTADPLIEGLQVEPRLVFNPTPPSIDVYPADPFQEGIAFGKANNDINLLVRARVSTAEHEAGQDLLLSMMDPSSATSVARAILSSKTLGSTVQNVSVSGPTSFGIFPDAGGGGNLIGCTWTVKVYP